MYLYNLETINDKRTFTSSNKHLKLKTMKTQQTQKIAIIAYLFSFLLFIISIITKNIPVLGIAELLNLGSFSFIVILKSLKK